MSIYLFLYLFILFVAWCGDKYLGYLKCIYKMLMNTMMMTMMMILMIMMTMILMTMVMILMIMMTMMILMIMMMMDYTTKLNVMH